MAGAPRGLLVPIDESNWRSALAVRVAERQLEFVADHQPVALVILAKAYVQPGGRAWEPLAFVVDGRVVAVLALAHGEGVSEIVNLAVDIDHQGRGVGRAVLAAARSRARASGSGALELTAHPSNEAVQALYVHAGLRPTGEVRHGEPVWRATLDDASAEQ